MAEKKEKVELKEKEEKNTLLEKQTAIANKKQKASMFEELKRKGVNN